MDATSTILTLQELADQLVAVANIISRLTKKGSCAKPEGASII